MKSTAKLYHNLFSGTTSENHDLQKPTSKERKFGTAPLCARHGFYGGLRYGVRCMEYVLESTALMIDAGGSGSSFGQCTGIA